MLQTVRIWDAVTGKALRTVYASTTTSIMAVSYSHGHLACCFGNTILLYNINTDTILSAAMQEHQARYIEGDEGFERGRGIRESEPSEMIE